MGTLKLKIIKLMAVLSHANVNIALEVSNK